MENVEELLKRLVECNTIEDKENTKIMDYIESILKQYNFKTEKRDKFLIMSNSDNCNIGFVGHTDTVSGNDDWKYEKFTTTKVDDKIFGLGVCDMKSGIAGIISAITQIDFKKLKSGIKLYFTYDEEIGFTGIKDVVEYEKNFPKTIIIGEPTNNKVMVGSKGLMEYKIQFKGIKVHSSTPGKGKNAIFSAIEFIQELKSFYENKISLSGTRMNVGKIDGGVSINSVPDFCEVLIDFRTSNKTSEEAIEIKIKELEEKYDATINVINKLSPFINEIEGSNEITNFITEASFLKNNRIILGAGPITAHEVDESISVKSLYNLVNQYKYLITKYCS